MLLSPQKRNSTGMMQSERFPFIVRRKGDEAFVAMDCGGVARGRPMPAWFLRDMATICRRMRDEVLTPGKNDPGKIARLAPHPHCSHIARCNMGPCEAVLFGAKDEAGTPEFGIAFYDAGDESAPALLLIEEQIQEFLDRVADVMKNYDPKGKHHAR